MIISARFSSTCNVCRQRIEVGASVSWSKGVKAVHAACPPARVAGDAGAVSGAFSERSDERAIEAALDADEIGLYQAIVNGDAEGPARAAQIALDLIEDRLFSEYEQATGYVAGSKTTDPLGNLLEGPIEAAPLPKGIYRVSLTGAEKVYGLDHVNVQVVPNARYQNVKVGEWHGESIGTYSTARGFRYWPSVDPTGSRTLAIKAAFAVLINAADPIEYAKAYAVESSTCWRCGADLVDEQSRARLMGPDCFRQQERGA